MAKVRDISSYISLLLVASFTMPAFAGDPLPVVTYQPLSSAVPTIGSGLLVILAALMVVLVYRFHKVGKNTAAMLAATFLLGALVSGGAGFKMVSDAMAVANRVELTQPSGSSVILSLGGNCLINTSGTAQQIKSISNLGGVYFIKRTGGSTCDSQVTEGTYLDYCSVSPPTTLSPNDGCFIKIVNGDS